MSSQPCILYYTHVLSKVIEWPVKLPNIFSENGMRWVLPVDIFGLPGHVANSSSS